MNTELEWVLSALFIGIGATLVMDLWAFCLKRFFGIELRHGRPLAGSSFSRTSDA